MTARLTRETVFKAFHDETIDMETWPEPIRNNVKTLRSWINGYHNNGLQTVVAFSNLVYDLNERQVPTR